MPNDSVVLIADVIIPRQRMRIANSIEALGESIRQNGLLHPITLRRAGAQLILVAGMRRLEACKYLRLGEIRAQILDIDEIHAKLIEIDENLQRAELTELQAAEHTAERKKIWESLYPQTKVGATPAKRGGGGKLQGKQPKNATLAFFGESQPESPSTDEPAVQLEPEPTQVSLTVPTEPTGQETPPDPPRSFVEQTAEATQASKRTVSRRAKIGEQICVPARELIRGTKTEDNQSDLYKLSKLDRNVQIAVAQLIHDEHGQGKAVAVDRARKLLEHAALQNEPAPLPEGPFRVIVVDPPWTYDKGADVAGHHNHPTYSTMSLEEIKALDIKAMSTDDAILWLWTTNAHLAEAFTVAKAWGFTYKTILTWDKIHMGTGNWLRGQTEHCLLCIRGKPVVKLTTETTLIREPRMPRHSKKPEAFYQLVESLCAGAKVELFARQPREGWQVWGNRADLTTAEEPE